MELYLPNRIYKNPKTGRFLKGHIPHNKGKKMSEYMDNLKIKKVVKCLELGRVGNPNIPGSNRRKTIGIKDMKIIGVYDSSCEAGRKTGLNASNIRHCCEGKRKKCGNIQWFWESEFNKWSKLVEQ